MHQASMLKPSLGGSLDADAVAISEGPPWSLESSPLLGRETHPINILSKSLLRKKSKGCACLVFLETPDNSWQGVLGLTGSPSL